MTDIVARFRLRAVTYQKKPPIIRLTKGTVSVKMATTATLRAHTHSERNIVSSLTMAEAVIIIMNGYRYFSIYLKPNSIELHHVSEYIIQSR